MSTFKEIIDRVDEYKVNAFSARVKLSWLTALDGKIAADVFLMDIGQIRELNRGYPADLEREPLVDAPHEDVYELWLEAKIDYANGEYDKYQNTMELYNECYRNFVRWFARVYEPALGRQVDGLAARSDVAVYYLTAYALALKQGFRGTLEEWLASLVGPKGDTGKTAYQYALEGGYTGTEEEFREHLIRDGKTAYHYAVEGGYTGTVEEFRLKMAAEYALADHNHDGTYAAANHDHDGTYAAANHGHEGTYAAANHGHDGTYAAANHDHGETYAQKVHDHDGEYLSSEGGTVNGALTVTGDFALNGGYFVGKVGVNIGTAEQRPESPPEGTVFFRIEE